MSSILSGHPCRCQSSHHTHIHTLASDDQQDGARWTEARTMADVVAAAYQRDPDARVRRWGARIAECGQRLTYAYDPIPGGDRYRRTLVQAQLCRVRTCPICAWRRAERLAADVGQAVQRLCQPGGLVPLMLTLTVRNCHVSTLREHLQAMLRGWSLMRRRRIFADHVVHWTRSVEITRGRGHIRGDSHPHLHCILMAHPDDAALLLCLDWSALWRDVLRLDYNPVTHIMPLDVAGRISEALKYTVKPHGLTQHAVSGWLGSVALAIDGVRVFACSEGLRLSDETPQDAEERPGHDEVDELPEGVPQAPRRSAVSITYRWTGRAYIRGMVTLGMGAAEHRAALMMLASAGRRR